MFETISQEKVLNFAAHRGEILECLESSDVSFVDTLHCDISEAMLKNISGKTLKVNTHQMPFLDGQFDLFISGMTLHQVNDLAKFISEASRILKPKGIFVANMFGPKTLWQLKQSIFDLEGREGVMTRVFPFIDIKQAGMLLQRSGLKMPVVFSEEVNIEYPSVFQLLKDIQFMAQSCTLKRRSSGLSTKRTIDNIIAGYESLCKNKITATFELIVMTGLN